MNDESQDDLPKGRARGGKARAANSTNEQRKAASLKAVEAKKHRAGLPKVAHKGELKIGEMVFSCCVLTDGRRIISENAINSNLGTSGGKTYRLRENTKTPSGDGPMPLFLASKALIPFIDQVFNEEDLIPSEYLDGDKINLGFEAKILPQVCEVWLQAAENKTLQPSQYSRAKKAEILIRGLANVGVIALVDEATGYQKVREKNALAKILEEFVAKELKPWVTTFPSDYYEGLFKIYGLEYPPAVNKNWRPSFIGNVTNNVIYSRLAPELLPELKKAASKAERKTKLHQWLTEDIGHPKLREHLSSIVTLLKISDTPEQFYGLVDKVHPKFDLDTLKDE